MKTLGEEIAENLNTFLEASSMSIKNVCDSITDGIEDARLDREEKCGRYARESRQKKSGCFGSLLSFLGWIVILSVVLAKCSGTGEHAAKPMPTQSLQEPSESVQASNTVEDSVFPLIEQQVSYANRHGIPLLRFPKEEAELNSWFETYDGDLCYVKTDQLFGENVYKRTSERSKYLYMGAFEDNTATGYGMLFKAADALEPILTYDDHPYDLLYAGHFMDGRCDGFGIQFRTSKIGCQILHEYCPYEYGTEQYKQYLMLWSNYAEYIGDFSKGKMTGKGNRFFLVTAEYDFLHGITKSTDNYDIDDPHFAIDIGEFKNGEPNGKIKCYALGDILYDGEMKDGRYDGYGKLYHSDGTTLKYEGHFKNDQYHGEGTSYSETGEVVYSGDWKYGDYGDWENTDRKTAASIGAKNASVDALSKVETSEPIQPTETQPLQMAPPSNESSLELLVTVKQSSGGLNIRSGPDVSYEKVGRLAVGETVTVTQVQSNGTSQWGLIDRGWICMDYVDIGSQQSQPTGGSSTSVNITVCVKLSAGELRIRSGPDTSYSEVGRLYGGEILTVTELQQTGGTQWGRISQGWVCMDYVDTVYDTQEERSSAQRFVGSWIESNNANKRCMMTIQTAEYGSFLIEVQLSLTAAESMHWYTMAEYDANQDCLKYSYCKCWISESDGNGSFREEVQYQDGQGKLYFSNGYLYWSDYSSGIDSCPFVPN